MELLASLSHPMVSYYLVISTFLLDLYFSLFLTYSIISVPGKHLVSVGGYMYLWNWRNGELVTKLQATSSSSAISSVSFSSDSKLIVTAGKRHLKFWVLGSSRRTQLNGGMGRTAPFAIHGKPANLSIQRGSSFISIASSVWRNTTNINFKQAGDSFLIYALTDAGLIWFRTTLRLMCFVLETLRHGYMLHMIY